MRTFDALQQTSEVRQLQLGANSFVRIDNLGQAGEACRRRRSKLNRRLIPKLFVSEETGTARISQTRSGNVGWSTARMDPWLSGLVMKPPATAEIPALEIERIGHRYGTRVALNDVSLSVGQSSFTVLLGLNGAGKSTLFSLITRLYAIRSGRIRIFGHDVAAEPGAALSMLGVVFQSRALDLDISVRQNLMYHAALHGISGRQADPLIAQVLERVAMTDRSRDRVGNLSIGQMRRIEIARALLHRPRLLLLDEPTVGLDIKARADILDHVRRLSTVEGIGVLWATHLIDEAGADDDVVVLHKGRVLAQGALGEVVGKSGGTDLRDAFGRLTGAADQRELEATA
jgi:ABC-2 type transport system ATP-binding protein